MPSRVFERAIGLKIAVLDDRCLGEDRASDIGALRSPRVFVPSLHSRTKALKAKIDQAMEDAQRALEGVAVALAMPTARVASGKTYGAAFNLAVFEGKVAVGAGAAMKIDDTFSLDGAAAIGLQHGTVGVKLGLTGRW